MRRGSSDYGPPTPEQHALFEANMDLVRILFHRLGASWRARRAGCDPDDLLQAMYLGLWQATYCWRPEVAKFRTCARHRIAGAMLDAVDVARFGRKRKARALIDHSQMRRLPNESNRDPEVD